MWNEPSLFEKGGKRHSAAKTNHKIFFKKIKKEENEYTSIERRLRAVHWRSDLGEADRIIET